MRRPGGRLIIVSLSIIAGFAIAYWGVMIGLLGTEYRLFGFVYLASTALLLATLFIMFLDKPLKLRAFEWDEAFWPNAEQVALPEARREKRRRPKVRLIIVSIICIVAGFAIAYWGVMIGLLGTEFRLFGYEYLVSTALLLAILFVVLLDKPLKLRTFE